MVSTSSFTLPSTTIFDVFLSFRGPDTRENFTSHLYKALVYENINNFMDKDLERGKEIEPSLLKAIEESEISVIVFSKGYASSPWCLDELVKILECRKTMGRLVLPIFYRVDPSDIEAQTGIFGDGFRVNEEQHKESMYKVHRWRSALKEAASISGWDSMEYRPESTLVEVVAKAVKENLSRLSHMSSVDSDGFVGIESSIEQIQSLLCTESEEVRFVGIWGMGGIGKSTCAEILYHRISYKFNGCCFLANVRETLRKADSISLLKTILSKVLEDRDIDIETPSVLPASIVHKLRRKKVLIVLDDVNEDSLVVNGNWFGPGSRIIMTSRDLQVFKTKVDERYIHEVLQLSHYDALQLLSLNAFKQKLPPLDYMELSERVLQYAQGLPLALKVLGSHLYKRSQKEWKSALNKLKQFPDSNIQKILKISYDELEKSEKDIFLDIACFLKGKNKDQVENFLVDCYDLAVNWGIIRLADKCLITIVHNKLEMHDLIQEMGRNIARQEGSRLLNAKDIGHLLTTNKGKSRVKGISFNISKMGKMHLDQAAFSGMDNLKYLKVYRSWGNYEDAYFILDSNYLRYLPNELRLLYWEEYPCELLPSTYVAENLVELNLPSSKIKRLWSGDQFPKKLKYLDLFRCEQLIELPNLSSATNIKSINLVSCKSLIEIPLSIQHARSLTSLDLDGCKNLKSVPSLTQLEYLEYLSLCWCSNLKKVPEIPRGMKEVYLNESGIEELPSSMECLYSLVQLGVGECDRLKSLPGSIRELKCLRWLDLSGCFELVEIPDDLVFLSSLEKLNLDNCKRLQGLPELPCRLETLRAGNCTLMKTTASTSYINIPKDSGRKNYEFNYSNCVNLDQNASCNIIGDARLRIEQIATTFKERAEHFCNGVEFFVGLPGREIPKWFSCESPGSSIDTTFPFGCFNAMFLGFAFSAVLSFEVPVIVTKILLNCKCNFKNVKGGDRDFSIIEYLPPVTVLESDHLFLWYNHYPCSDDLYNELVQNCYNVNEASFTFTAELLNYNFDLLECEKYKLKMKSCGVKLIYAKGTEQMQS
ncbi:disease resistance protein RPV1 [Hevea brasiliensis]|uniref:disease resistance protein RPV1 n=1 Tax=Hevea brasiliensis TaxID=3981 RepID=UPI0025D34C16|nr:disease resistance protein RPV1 [Hevea brasiliensis]